MHDGWFFSSVVWTLPVHRVTALTCSPTIKIIHISYQMLGTWEFGKLARTETFHIVRIERSPLIATERVALGSFLHLCILYPLDAIPCDILNLSGVSFNMIA